MTRLFTSGAEAGHIHAEGLTLVGTTLTFDTGTVRSGARSFKFDASAQNLLVYTFTGVAGRGYYLSAQIYLPAATGYPSANTRILGLSTTANHYAVQLTTTGTLRLIQNVTVIGSASAVLSTDTWYRIELFDQVGSGSSDDSAEFRLNGSTIASESNQTRGTTAATNMYFGWNDDPGTSEVIYIDDVVLNDDQGSVNNTWAGDQKVVLLLPTADSARDAGWTAGAGGTTDLWDAVNNTPPVGVASGAGTNTSQLRNTANTITQKYRATMQTYTAAGIGGSDTITAIQGVIEGGSSTTTVQSIGVTVESNPVIAEVTPSTASSTSTYPTGWVRMPTTMTENPTVTLGTAPVMSVRRNVAATTPAANVCLMAMYVSYTVGTAPTGTRHTAVMMVGD